MKSISSRKFFKNGKIQVRTKIPKFWNPKNVQKSIKKAKSPKMRKIPLRNIWLFYVYIKIWKASLPVNFSKMIKSESGRKFQNFEILKMSKKRSKKLNLPQCIKSHYVIYAQFMSIIKYEKHLFPKLFQKWKNPSPDEKSKILKSKKWCKIDQNSKLRKILLYNIWVFYVHYKIWKSSLAVNFSKMVKF